VLCYFTALQLHALTTQVPTHHHIARLTTHASAKTISDRQERSTNEGTGQRRFDPLGTLQFRYEGVAYYRTHREPGLMPGTVWRDFSDKTRCRVTTLEQTLLDALHRPLACGGPPVVLEAWTRGVSDLNQSRLHDYLVALGDDRITRRVGYLLEANNFRFQEPLLGLLDEVKSRSSGAEPISLLPGIPYVHVDTTWRVTTP
jgi:predicted transcriptional regulator of viral defense system